MKTKVECEHCGFPMDVEYFINKGGVHTIHVGKDSCPMCDNPIDSSKMFDKVVEQVEDDDI